jgi:hypothetical protein
MSNTAFGKRGVTAAVVIGGFAVLASSGATAQPAATSRYPYDPACPWGRLSNGKGLIVRCLSESEHVRLSTGTSEAPPAAASDAPVASSAPPSDVPPPDAAAERVTVTVGPVIAETGKLPQAEKLLSAARQRMAQCFEQGGLKAASGEVQVKFLVRPRGRAEGVSVGKRSNVSAKAARCVADVVDRRYVGTPEASLVPASVTIKITRAAR